MQLDWHGNAYCNYRAVPAPSLPLLPPPPLSRTLDTNTWTKCLVRGPVCLQISTCVDLPGSSGRGAGRLRGATSRPETIGLASDNGTNALLAIGKHCPIVNLLYQSL